MKTILEECRDQLGHLLMFGGAFMVLFYLPPTLTISLLAFLLAYVRELKQDTDGCGSGCHLDLKFAALGIALAAFLNHAYINPAV